MLFCSAKCLEEARSRDNGLLQCCKDGPELLAVERHADATGNRFFLLAAQFISRIIQRLNRYILFSLGNLPRSTFEENRSSSVYVLHTNIYITLPLVLAHSVMEETLARRCNLSSLCCAGPIGIQ